MSLAAIRLLEPQLELTAALVQRRCMAELRSLGDGAEAAAPPPQTYHVLPWLFRDVFEPLEDAILERVAVSGLLYFSHVTMLDQALDGDRSIGGAELLLASRMHERALTLLFPILPHDTVAWDRLAAYVREYAAAVLAERSLARRLQPFPSDRFEEVARGKSAVLKGAPLMLACATGAEERLPAIESALDAFAVAAQIEDDLKDWREDYRAGRYSHLLVEALARAGATAPSDGDRPAAEVVGNAVFFSPLASELLDRAEQACARSVAEAERVGGRIWGRFAAAYGAQLRELGAGFRRLRSAGLAAAGRAPLTQEIDAALGRFLPRLVSEHDRGYPEMRHVMRFPRPAGFGSAEELHVGEVFQRALVACVAERLRERAGAVEPRLVEENLDALLAARRPGDRGGWAYFPTLEELPPDADDLAQVLEAFLGAGGPGLADRFEEPVALTLGGADGAGGIPTWIVDPEDRRREVYEAGIEKHWGRGTDPEVIANFCYALQLWDRARFAAPAAAGAARIAAMQRPEGWWESTWYVGPFYGTYVCTRLLAALDTGAEARARALAWLVGTQRLDGGWGEDDESTPLATALGLLAALAGGAGVAHETVIHRAARYLLLTQRDDGFWSAAPFIRMDVNRAAGGPPKLLVYSSATVAALFGALALAEARPGVAVE